MNFYAHHSIRTKKSKPTISYRPGKKHRRFLALVEQLEERRLLSTLTITSNALTYNANSSSASNLTIFLDSANQNLVIFSDADQLITLSGGTGAWSGNGTHTVIGPVSSFNSMSVTGSTVLGQGLTLDYGSGDPLPATGLSFTPTAATGGANNTLALENSVGSYNLLSENYSPTGVGAGVITYNDSQNSNVPITFSNLSQPIADTVYASSLSFTAPANPGLLTVNSGQFYNGTVTTEIDDGGYGYFPSIDFGDKATVTVNANVIGAYVTVNVPDQAAAGLTTLNIDTTATDTTVSVIGTLPTFTTNVDTGAAASITNIGNGIDFTSVQGKVVVTGSANSLLIDEVNGGNSATATIQQDGSDAALTGFTDNPIEWTAEVPSVVIYGGSANSGTTGVTYNIFYTTADSTTTIHADSLPNTYVVGDSSSGGLDNIQGALVIQGNNGGADTMTVDDSDNSHFEAYIINDPTIERDGFALVTYSNIATVNLNTSTGAGSVVSILSNNEAVNVNLDNADSHDSVNVGGVSGGGDMTGIQGPISLTDSDGYFNLTFHDENDTSAQTWTLNDDDGGDTASAAVSGDATINYRPYDINNLAFNGGSGGNTFIVNDVTGAAPTTINSGTGDDTTDVYNTEPDADLTLDGQDGYDTITLGGNTSAPLGMQGFGEDGQINIPNTLAYTNLTLDDSEDTTGQTATLTNDGSDGTISGLAPVTINYTDPGLDALNILGGSGGNTFNVNGILCNPFVTNAVTTINKGSGSGNTVNVSATNAGSTLDLTGTGMDDAVNLGAGSSLAALQGAVEINEANASTNMVIDLSADALPHNLVLSGDGTMTTLSDTLGNLQPITFLTAAVNSLAIDTSPTQDESLTVDFSDGNPIPNGLTFNGGADSSSPADSHSLILQGGSFTSETEVATDPSTGSFTLTQFGGGDTDINYSGIQPITDTVPAATYTFNDVATDQSFSATSGPTVGGASTIVFTNTPGSSSTATFEATTIANKGTVIFNAPNQNTGLTATINIPTASTGLATLVFNIDANSGNELDVITTPAAVATTINGSPAVDDTTFVGGGVPNGSTVTLTGGAGDDTLAYNASANNPTIDTGAPGELLVAIPGAGALDATGYENVDFTNIAIPTIMPGSAKTISATQGNKLNNAVVGTFTMPLPTYIGAAPAGLPASDFTATIHWGDGTASTAATIVQDAGDPAVYDIVGSHNYAQAGDYTVSDSVAFAGGAYSSMLNGVALNVAVPPSGPTAGSSASASVTPSEITVTVPPIVGTEGIAIPGGPIATFTQAGTSESPSSYTATITIYNANGASVLTEDGTIIETANDKYAVEIPALTLPTTGTYGIAVAVTNTLSSTTNTAAGTATISHALLTAGSPVAITNHTGSALANIAVGTFTSADPTAPLSDFSALVYWGDGTNSIGSITQPGGAGTAFIVTGSHTYTTPGTFVTTADVSDAGGSTLALAGSTTVTDLAVNGSANNFSVAAGQSTGAIVLATFTDPNPLATVSDVYAFLPANGWGDGAPTSATPLAVTEIGATSAGSIFEITGSHTYATTGSFPVNISVTTTGGVTTALTAGTASVFSEVSTPVSTPAITAGSSVALTTYTDSALTNVTVGSFASGDPTAPLSDFSAIINWGDGASSIGSITQPGGVGTAFIVTGSHTYAAPGTFATTLDVSDADGSTLALAGTATALSEVLTSVSVPTITGTAKLSTGTLVVGTFTDANPSAAAGDYSAIIDWGDGSPTTIGTISVTPGTNGAPATVAVNGAHTYANFGAYTIHVMANSSDGQTLTTTTLAEINAPHLVFTSSPTSTTAGNKLPAFTITAEDATNNVATTDHSNVNLLIYTAGSGKAKLVGRGTAQLRNGVATFSNVSIKIAGDYTIEAVDGRYASTISSVFSVAPTTPKRVKFVSVSSSAVHGAPFSAQVEVLDKYGNVVTDDNSTIALALGKHPRGLSLAGALAANVTAGLADFDDLLVAAGGDYTLIASDSNHLAKVTSKRFAVS